MAPPPTHGFKESDHRDDDLPFSFRRITLQSEVGEHDGVVMTPTAPMVVDRERIEQLRRSTDINSVERALLARINAGNRRGHVLLLRAVNDDGGRVWQFDPSLSDDELVEAGTVLSRALLPFHRRCLAGGVVQMVHTDWGIPECHALRAGMQRLTEQLEASDDSDDSIRAVDLWILKHWVLYVALSLQHVVEKLLPDHLRLIERRRAQIEPLLAALPAEAID